MPAYAWVIWVVVAVVVAISHIWVNRDDLKAAQLALMLVFGLAWPIILLVCLVVAALASALLGIFVFLLIVWFCVVPDELHMALNEDHPCTCYGHGI